MPTGKLFNIFRRKMHRNHPGLASIHLLRKPVQVYFTFQCPPDVANRSFVGERGYSESLLKDERVGSGLVRPLDRIGRIATAIEDRGRGQHMRQDRNEGR